MRAAARDMVWIPPDDTRYTYAVAVIRALEHTLLRRKTLEAMARAFSPEEAFQELGETFYVKFMSPGLSAAGFETLLSAVLKDTYGLFRRLVLDESLERAVLSVHDFHNLKAILKSKWSGLGEPVGLVPYGLFDPHQLASAVESGAWRDLSPALEHAATAAMKSFELASEPRRVEMIIDRSSMEARIAPLLALGAPAQQRYARALADTANIKLLVRLNHMDPDYTCLEHAFIEHGKIPFHTLAGILGKNTTAVIDALALTTYAKALREGLLYLEDQGSYAALDRELENLLMNSLRASRFTIFGAGPLLAHVFAREHEVRMVRLIMVAKMNNIPTDRLIARLSVLYV